MESMRNNRFKTVIGLALGISALSLSGCGESPSITEGRPALVTGKEYDDADTWVQLVGKTPMTRHDEEHFYMELQQCDRKGESGADDNGCVTAKKEVDQVTYEAHEVGSTITLEAKE